MEVIHLKLEDVQKESQVKNLIQDLTISDVKVKKLKATFEDELEKGLKAGLKASSLQMENTYVPELTNGKEEGCYLALDLGGTNFRVMFLEMTSGKIVKEEVTYYTVQEATRLGHGDKLFDFLAECIADFIHNKLGRDPNDPAMPLGFTFSFPMEQRGMDVGVLVSWTKSFNAAGVVGQDAVKMLNDAIKRQGNLNVNVVAILNDATGTLVKGAYDDSKTAIGLILGTGCNGAYLEEASKVVNWYGDRHDAKEVIIDPEFGAFGDNGCIDFIKTDVDMELDKESLLPGGFTYEKYFAGKYIGEVVRLVLVKLHKAKLFIPNEEIKSLLTKDAFTAAMLSDVMLDSSKTREIIEAQLGIKGTSKDDLAIIEHVCAILSERCCLLVSIPLAVFIDRMTSKEHVAIAVTGSLYKHHPQVKTLMEKYISKLCPGRQFHTFLSDDGSGKGAGLVAAIAARLSSS